MEGLLSTGLPFFFLIFLDNIMNSFQISLPYITFYTILVKIILFKGVQAFMILFLVLTIQPQARSKNVEQDEHI